MTRRLSQATLNTYWTAFDSDTQNTIAEFQYRRISELQFLSGEASRIFTAPTKFSNLNPQPEFAYPTHAVFFNAPIGATAKTETTSSSSLNFRSMNSLLLTCGYFLEYGDDPDRPRFLNNSAQRFRSRLMELTVPSENLMIFQRNLEGSDPAKLHDITPQVLDETGSPYIGLVGEDRRSTASWTHPLWMKEGLRRIAGSQGSAAKFFYSHPLAENVVALIILPKLAVRDRATPERLDELAPNYEFDSWRILKSGVTAAPPTPRGTICRRRSYKSSW